MASRKVVMIVTNYEQLGSTGKKTGYYLPEAAIPYLLFVERGFSVDVASPRGGKAPIDEYSLQQYKTDATCSKFLSDQEIMKKFNQTMKITDVIQQLKNYHAVVYVGGHGPMWDFVEDANIGKLAALAYEDNRIVASICHGAAAFVNATLSSGEPLIKGKKITCFSHKEEEQAGFAQVVPFSLEQRLREKGADVSVAEPKQPNVVKSNDRIVTAQNEVSARQWAQTIADVLKARTF